MKWFLRLAVLAVLVSSVLALKGRTQCLGLVFNWDSKYPKIAFTHSPGWLYLAVSQPQFQDMKKKLSGK
jgi:hypothetical protein